MNTRFKGHITKENEELFCNCYNKLVQIEDLEEEFGLDFTIACKALKNGIWVKDFNGIEHRYIDFICESAVVVEYWSFDETHYVYYHFRDYGMQWALTKKELECKD